MPEYDWICLKKQDSEYALGPTYARILNMTRFWIWQGFQYVTIKQGSDYARISLDSVLNIARGLNMSGFWRCVGSENVRILKMTGFWKWLGSEYYTGY